MLTTKIRTTIIALVATFSVAAAVGPMAPAASALYVRFNYEYCHQMKEGFEAEIEKYAKSGGTDVKAFNEAVEYLRAAEAHGCSWTGGESARIVSPVRSVTSTPTSAHL